MATNTFYLKVIAANRVFYSGRCRSIIVPEFDGQKEILAHHEDMVIAVDEGEMRFQPAIPLYISHLRLTLLVD